MSACAEFRAMILEAEPGELRAEGEDALAVHLRSCPDCARVAALVLEGTVQLDQYLGDAPGLDVDALLKRASLPVAAPRPRPFPGRRLWLPLAAAAAIATLVLMRAGDVRRPATSVASSPSGTAAAPLVEPIAGQDAAIVQTDDPEITVVWLFSTG